MNNKTPKYLWLIQYCWRAADGYLHVDDYRGFGHCDDVVTEFVEWATKRLGIRSGLMAEPRVFSVPPGGLSSTFGPWWDINQRVLVSAISLDLFREDKPNELS